MRNTESGRSKRMRVAIFVLLIAVSFGLFMASRNPATPNVLPDQSGTEQDVNRGEGSVTDELPDEHGRYTTPEDVASYLHAYGELTVNYITKKQARALGWNSSEGNLWDVTDELSIGGDAFGNRERLLPEADGRQYYECDVNYEGGYRGSERLVYSNDGLIFYTDDHYATYVRLY
ncbi:MAG: ribonuclease domain-containing protein [Anaerovoracaceae bacterium]|jgi:ribonuclease T1